MYGVKQISGIVEIVVAVEDERVDLAVAESFDDASLWIVIKFDPIGVYEAISLWFDGVALEYAIVATLFKL